MSIETLVIIILALLVLVIVAYSFSSGMKNLINRLVGIQSTIPQNEIDQATATCKSYCDAKSQSFCSHEFAGDLAGKKCKDFMPSCTVACT